MRYLITILIATTTSGLVMSQQSNFNTSRNWSKNKKEIIFGVGATQFLGDLGGRDQIGKDYSLADMDFPSTGLNAMGGFRYRFHPYFATTSLLSVGLIRGSDANTEEIARQSRNLSFRSPVINFTQRFEIIVLANEKFGKRYFLPGMKGFREHNDQLYVFSGIGITYFNPQAQYNDVWTNLRPLSTEGQGLAGGPAKYSPVTAAIPFGVGFRMAIGSMWRMGIEASYVKTFTDYMDDVSGVYYDPAALASQIGPEAAYLSNPSQQNQSWFTPGEKRGDEQNDAYFYVNIVFMKNITYKNYAKRQRLYRWKGSKAKF